MKVKISEIILALTLSSIVAQATTLVGSFHIPYGTSTNGSLNWLSGVPTRTASGDAETRGTVLGELSVLGGHPAGLNSHPGLSLGAWMGVSQIAGLNRWPLTTTEAGCAVVYDFDVSGVSSPTWALKVGYEGRRSDCPEADLYASFTGLGRTLDATAVTNLPIGTGGTLVSDATKYVKIGSLPANTTSGTFTWDITEIVEAAQTNGGLIRLVYTDHGYKSLIKWVGDSGLIASDAATGTPVVVETLQTLFSDDFSSGVASNDNGLLPNGWVGLGPEPKEYNMASSGILDIRDHDGDEKTNGTYHTGFFDTVQAGFNGSSLTNIGDWLQLSMDIGLYVDDSGAPMPDGVSEFRVTLTEEGMTNDAGYGILLAHGSFSTSQIWTFDNPYTYASPLGTLNYDYPDNGTLVPLRMKLTRVSTGNLELSTSWNGIPMVNATTNFAANNMFNLLNVTLTTMDVGCKIDNVKIVSNVSPLDSYTLWTIAEGLQSGVNDDPTDDPDGDGLDNLSEYGLGGAPTNPADRGITPVCSIALENGTNWFTYVYPERSAPSAGISYHLETKTDLMSPSGWIDGNYEVVGVGFSGGDFVYVTNRINTGTESTQFIKLMIEKTP